MRYYTIIVLYKCFLSVPCYPHFILIRTKDGKPALKNKKYNTIQKKDNNTYERLSAIDMIFKYGVFE